jgi:hypothetical protein
MVEAAKKEIRTMLDLFKTADYAMAAYLLACGVQLSRLESQGAQVVFCFPSSPQLVAAVGDYTSNHPIPCRDYFRALRRAKTLIMENTYNTYANH